MDLKNYIKIFAKNWVWLLVTVAIVLGIGIGYKKYQDSKPISYEVSLLLNVTRLGTQSTDAYRFDDFYRLQADERFADTVVRWLESPRIVSNIYNEIGKVSGDVSLKELSSAFKAKRLTSQVIEVDFKSESASSAQDTSVAVTRMLNEESKSLNQFQKEDSWFKVIGDEPVIKEYKVSWKNVLLVSIVLGIFLGFWVVLIKHYLTRE